jgi:glycine/D-amino acid oxidase-like deaminating enzyme/nitrite reductase/ring-hydroxylating ferredoxin subunit
MNTNHGPYWSLVSEAPVPAPPLTGVHDLDVLVVGAGITGLTAAMTLQQAGRQVSVIDLGEVGSGTTGHSTGHLDGTADEGMHRLVRVFGLERARTVLQAKYDAVEHISAWDREFALDSDFVRVPAYYFATDDHGAELVARECEAAGVLGRPTTALHAAPLPFAMQRALVFPEQARFNPLQYVRGLAAALQQRGGRVHAGTLAIDFSEHGGRVHVTTRHGRVTADAVVLAGHTPLLGLFTIEPRSHPYQSYVLAVQVTDDVPDALYWDTARPYHYIRRARSGDDQLLIVGGADHATGRQSDTRESFAALERYARTHFRVEHIKHRWSAEFFEPSDGLPYVGLAPGYERVFLAGAYSGDGLTYGTVAGQLLADAVLGRSHPLAEILSPARIKPLASAARTAGAAVRVIQHFVGDRLRGGEISGLDELRPGEGALVVHNGQRVAAYRDPTGHLEVISPVCSHMQCIVHWNAAERTWDCPCHGGRYDARGKLIYGPPKADLNPIALADKEA